jgi:hypothetical protein
MRSLLAYWAGGAFSVGTFVPPPVTTGITPAGSGKRERQRRIIVEIDGEEFTVRSEAEAQALLNQAHELARGQAQVAAKSALNRARKIKRKTGGLRLPTLEVAIPEIRLRTPDPAIAEMVQAAQRAMDEIYLREAQIVEMTYLARIELDAQDDEDVITLLLG